jgi:ribosomal protein S27E
MSTALLYYSVVGIDMAVNESQFVESTAPSGAPETTAMTSDRYCRQCTEIALAYDPSAGRARCRSCGELA